MGLFSLFQPSNSETTDGYSNLDQSSTSTRYVPNQSYKERKSLSERVEMANGLRVKYPTKIPIIVERFRMVSDNIICFFQSFVDSVEEIDKVRRYLDLDTN